MVQEVVQGDRPKLLIASDHGGFALKEWLRGNLEAEYEIIDFGCHSEESVDYPDYAAILCQRLILEHRDSGCEAARGILVCGTGIGMCIAANKHRGVRAALCHDIFSARATREHNDSNVLCLGGRVVGPGLALEIVKTWLGTSFTAGRHQRRVAKVTALEQK